VRAVTGGIPHPLAGYLLHRGLQTLPVRVHAQQASARRVAEWLGVVVGQAGFLVFRRQMFEPGCE
jgi:methionine-gamma-lyase